MESLDRPYGDDETDYETIHPEAEPAAGVPDTGDAVEDEVRLAAAEAAGIGGAPEADDTARVDGDQAHAGDPAWQAVQEGGGGEAEGFEEAEALLIEHAEDPPDAETTADGFDLDDPGTDVDPDAVADVEKELADVSREDVTAVPRRLEAQDAGVVAGEADEVSVTEAVADPEEPEDDPGRGPGITSER